MFTKDEAQAQAARAAGADLVGAEELVAQVKDGTIAFERALATPDAMPVLSQVARILGPKGLMPSPKRGTVLSDVADAVREAKAGQVEYAADRNAVVHVPFGKRSFELHKLQANLHVLVTAVLKARPDQYQRKPPKVRLPQRACPRPGPEPARLTPPPPPPLSTCVWCAALAVAFYQHEHGAQRAVGGEALLSGRRSE